MARYTAAVCRLCRREGRKLNLKGDRCIGPKCAINKRNFPPGQHGLARIKPTPYGLQLREKQRARRIYGVLERQFRRMFANANRMRGVTATLLMQLLETRLDNIVYRMGLASSRSNARQMVLHGHVRVNDRKVDIPSCQVKVGQTISLKAKMKEHAMVKSAMDGAAKRPAITWIEMDEEGLKGRLLAIPSRADIPVELNEQLIVELYSK